MVKRYQFGGMTLTFCAGGTQYSTSTTLDESVEKNIKIVKHETDGHDTNEICYSLMQGDAELAFVRGYLKSPTRFHIGRVENATGDRISGFRYLSHLYRIVENDLRESGVQSITSLSLAKLAHIAVKRYGFYDTDGKSYEDLKNSWLKIIPWKAVSLEKKL